MSKIASFEQLDTSIKHYVGILHEDWQHQIKLMGELIDTRPTRDEVREIVREEIRPLRQEMTIFKEEMVSLRKEYNNHMMILH